MMESKVFSEIFVGMSASSAYLITDEKIRAFAAISEDFNPIHLSDEYAIKTRFGKRIAHGAMISSLISSLFAMKLPGPGCIYISQSAKFKKPVYIQDNVLVEIKVTSTDSSRNRVFFNTFCYVNDEVVLEGTAEIYMPN